MKNFQSFEDFINEAVTSIQLNKAEEIDSQIRSEEGMKSLTDYQSHAKIHDGPYDNCTQFTETPDKFRPTFIFAKGKDIAVSYGHDMNGSQPVVLCIGYDPKSNKIQTVNTPYKTNIQFVTRKYINSFKKVWSA